MMETIAAREGDTRRDVVETVKSQPRRDGQPLRRIAWLGSSVLDNEENYLIAKLARGMGLVNLENSARLCHSATVPPRLVVRTRSHDDQPDRRRECRRDHGDVELGRVSPR